MTVWTPDWKPVPAWIRDFCREKADRAAVSGNSHPSYDPGRPDGRYIGYLGEWFYGRQLGLADDEILGAETFGGFDLPGGVDVKTGTYWRNSSTLYVQPKPAHASWYAFVAYRELDDHASVIGYLDGYLAARFPIEAVTFSPDRIRTLHVLDRADLEPGLVPAVLAIVAERFAYEEEIV
jgi:hypothetical protein